MLERTVYQFHHLLAIERIGRIETNGTRTCALATDRARLIERPSVKAALGGVHTRNEMAKRTYT